MSDWISPIFALLTAAAGWFYLFYSRAAHRLADVESNRLNRVRVRLRRLGGGVMLTLGVAFYVGLTAVDPETTPRTFLAIWIGVLTLMATLVILAIVDLRFTLRLRTRNRPQMRDRN